MASLCEETRLDSSSLSLLVWGRVHMYIPFKTTGCLPYATTCMCPDYLISGIQATFKRTKLSIY